jgi:homoserine O-acetyltransferase
MTRRHLAWTAFTALVLTTALASAHTPNQPPHQLHKMGDLKLESGEAIKDFAISYVTHGKLNAKKSNAILMVTAISGNHHRLDFMIGPGKSLDTDNISSSPPMRSRTASPPRRATARRSRACSSRNS